MPNIVKTYSDLDLNFIPHPVSKDIVPLRGADAVKRAIRNLILTAFYERPFQPGLGSGLKQLLFEPINPLTKNKIETVVTDLIKNFESTRATLIEVVANVNPDENGYDVSITFAVDSLSEFVNLTVFLERVR